MGTNAGVRLSSVLMAVLVTLVASSASAGSFEITLLGGMRMGGEFQDSVTHETRWLDAGPSFGLALGFPLEPDRTLEVVWTHEEGQVAGTSDGGAPVGLDLDNIGIGGTYEWSQGKVRPFVSGTLGMMIVSPELVGAGRDAFFTMSLGGGVKIPVSRTIAIRFEGRGFLVLATGDSSGVCGSAGCVLSYSGSGLTQLELLTGVSWTF